MIINKKKIHYLRFLLTKQDLFRMSRKAREGENGRNRAF